MEFHPLGDGQMIEGFLRVIGIHRIGGHDDSIDVQGLDPSFNDLAVHEAVVNPHQVNPHYPSLFHRRSFADTIARRPSSATLAANDFKSIWPRCVKLERIMYRFTPVSTSDGMFFVCRSAVLH